MGANKKKQTGGAVLQEGKTSRNIWGCSGDIYVVGWNKPVAAEITKLQANQYGPISRYIQIEGGKSVGLNQKVQTCQKKT